MTPIFIIVFQPFNTETAFLVHCTLVVKWVGGLLKIHLPSITLPYAR